ncbi:glycosyltransferase [Brachyspira intermedia]|uniref:glycosyltransferase family 8 protein n=1 Tax=Brachyspira intermedia TaxID=84377 RepID=UPI003004E751
MNETMNICLISDNNFVNYLATLIVSILKNSSDEDKFYFHIIEVDITDENKSKIMQLKEIKNCEISFYKSPYDEKAKHIDKIIKELHPFHSWHYSNFYKLYIPFMFKDIDNILYLDSDEIAINTISEIFNTDISNYYCMCQKAPYKGIDNDIPKVRDWMKDIGIKEPRDEYLHGLILFFNLKKIREDIGLNNLEKKIDECMDKYSSIIFTEEHILLYLFNGKIGYNDFGCNVDANGEKLNTKIVHFIGGTKPLLKGYNGREIKFYNKFWEYFTLTPFFKDNIFEYMNIFALNKYKGPLYKLIDKIVWYIPIRKLRYKTREKMINKVNSMMDC